MFLVGFLLVCKRLTVLTFRFKGFFGSGSIFVPAWGCKGHSLTASVRRISWS